MTKLITRQRVNITLPRETIHLIDRVTERGDRSRFLDEAVRFYVKEAGCANLRRLIQDGAQRHAGRDLNLIQEWFPLEHEIWQKSGKG